MVHARSLLAASIVTGSLLVPGLLGAVHAGCSSFGDEPIEGSDSGAGPDAGDAIVSDAPPVGDVGPAPDVSSDAGPAGACPVGSCKYVFVTSAKSVAAFGGIVGADAICAAAATQGKAALKTRVFKAWVSMGDVSPANRFATKTLPYRRIDGELFAADFTALTTTGPVKPVAFLEDGVDAPSEPVWTGTHTSGLSAFPSNCGDWASLAGSATIGRPLRKDAFWTEDPAPMGCNQTAHLYCFEDP